ncbi:Uu.00g144290.m01.CDS01 [Anthostomella pinea]|uniref:Uu.00g144290.m01.CDS01 n=1 Tax=Anthostomella pinea TaxID=933095 RepID=A0AAI8VRQ4_9PEZI|nr:Uu.00g144290.m01.CDS01 [Anthostomella pinea]
MAIEALPDEEIFLRDQSRQLYHAWTKFCDRLPEGQRDEMSKGTPSLKFLHESVAKASQTWTEKRGGTRIGRVKGVFTRLCDNFTSHSNLVSVLPVDDKYVTLLTGSLSAIAQASINHQELADGVAESLDELSQDMVYWNRLISEYSDTAILQRYIMELYVVVFEFLTEIFTQWSRSSWKRFIKSFDENAFQNIFSEKRNRIKAIEQRMKKHAELEFQRSTREQLRITNALQEEIKQRQTHMELRFQAMMQDQPSQQQLIMKLGTDLYRLLLSQGVAIPPHEILHERPQLTSSVATLCLPAPVAPEWKEASMNSSSPKPNEERGNVAPSYKEDRGGFDRQITLALLAPITAKYNQDIQNIVAITSRASNITIDHHVKRRIDAWTTSQQSDSIWLQGPHEISHPSQNTLTAVCLVALSNNSDIPCLSYFCSLEVHASGHPRIPSCRDMLLDLVKSFIVQLLLLLPEQVGDTTSLSPERFAKLVDPGVELDDALSLLHDLRAHAPPYLHCVIEAAQEVEDRSDSKHTRNLLRVLRELVESPRLGNVPGARDQGRQQAEKVIKVCLTTDGYVDALAELAQKGAVEKVQIHEETHVDGTGDGSSLMPH